MFYVCLVFFLHVFRTFLLVEWTYLESILLFVALCFQFCFKTLPALIKSLPMWTYLSVRWLCNEPRHRKKGRWKYKHALPAIWMCLSKVMLPMTTVQNIILLKLPIIERHVFKTRSAPIRMPKFEMRKRINLGTPAADATVSEPKLPKQRRVRSNDSDTLFVGCQVNWESELMVHPLLSPIG